MVFKLFLLFTAVPLLELMILIELGNAVGLSATIGIILLTGAIGAWAARMRTGVAWPEHATGNAALQTLHKLSG